MTAVDMTSDELCCSDVKCMISYDCLRFKHTLLCCENLSFAVLFTIDIFTDCIFEGLVRIMHSDSLGVYVFNSF